MVMATKPGRNARARTRSKRATLKRHINQREREWASQDPPPRRGRHGKPSPERSNGARLAIERGDVERRGGRDRGERKGGPPLSKIRGTPRHPEHRPSRES
jgi:hypothetical protein